MPTDRDVRVGEASVGQDSVPTFAAVGFGSPARTALVELVRRHQARDPLAPITVVVPSAHAEITLRRALAARLGGSVGVRYVALPSLVELIAGPGLAADAGSPASPATQAAAVRRVLSASAGPLASVAGNPATEQSLGATFADLADASASTLETLAGQSARAADLVSLYRGYRELLGNRLERADLTRLAAATVRRGHPLVAELGVVVVYLPRRLSSAEVDLVAALAGRGQVSALVGVTGDPEADVTAERLCDQLQPHLGPPRTAATPTPPRVDRVVRAPDPEEEVRMAVRLIIDGFENGIDADRVAVVMTTTAPYGLLVPEQLAAAGIAHHGWTPGSLAQSVPGRFLVGLLELAERDFRRDELIRWLRSAPILVDGDAAPVPEWDRAARRAGVVGGAEQWAERLATYREDLGRDRDETTDDARRERLERRVDDARRLARFVDDLVAGQIDQDQDQDQAWPAFSTWCQVQLDRYLLADRASWPVDQQAAVDAVVDVVAHLAEVHDIEPAPSAPVCRRVLAEELGRSRSRVGRFGRGVLVGTIADLVGADYDLVVVVGATEGALPPRGRDDPLLPDAERRAADDQVPTRLPAPGEARRDFLAALSAAPSVVVSFPRADLRAQRETAPAPWLLELAGANAGAPVYADDLDGLRVPWFLSPPSLVAWLLDGNEAGSAQEYDTASLLRSRVDSALPAGHPLMAHLPALGRGIEAIAARQNGDFSAWTGHVGEVGELALSDDRPGSATTLEIWARCPFRYFLDKGLGLRERDEPVELDGISGRDRGSLVHRVLEVFVGAALGRPSDQPWTEADRHRLLTDLESVGGHFVATGRTGRPLQWRIEARRLVAILDGFLTDDETYRAAEGVSPAAVELGFGPDGEAPPVAIPLPSGRRLRFRGMIDRVDRSEAGDSVVVLDYKTGSRSDYLDLQPDDSDVTDRGRHLQLALYGEAARAHFGAPEVAAHFWFVDERKWIGREIGDPARERLHHVVGRIAEGIEQGLFPARPGIEEPYFATHENCRFCPYDRVCPADRSALWEGVRRHPQLADYRELSEPEEATS